MNRRHILAAAMVLALPGATRAQSSAPPAPLPKITLGVPNTIGVAPLFLAQDEGLFHKNGVDVDIRVASRDELDDLLVAGKLDGIVTSFDEAVATAASGHPFTQVLLLDRDRGGYGLVATPGTADVAALKGKRVACDGKGSPSFFLLCVILQKAGLSPADVHLVTLTPPAAAAALLAGQCDAACVTAEALAAARKAPDTAKVLATTLDFPILADTLAFHSWYVAAQAVNIRGLVAGWFDALALIAADPDKAYAAMGKRTDQDSATVRAAADLVEWPNRAKTRAIMVGDMGKVMKDVAALMVADGLIDKEPDLARLVDTQFITG